MLENAFIIAFIVYFVKATTWKGMIFYEVKEYLQFLPGYLRMPLFQCPVCMTPWYGTAIYLLGFFMHFPEFADLSVLRVIFTVFTAGGINAIVLMINKAYDKYIHSQE